MEQSEVFDRWLAWLEVLRNNLNLVHHHREMSQELTDAIHEHAPETPSTWLDHYRRLYADGQTMAIRRIIRSASGPNSVTFVRLLESIQKNADLLTEERHVARWAERHDATEDHWLRKARGDYRLLWGDGAGALDLGKVTAARARLNEINATVIAFANTVAHIIEGQPVPSLTYGRLHSAMDETGAIFQSYAALLTGTHYVLTPVVQGNWRSTFDRPLLGKAAARQS